MAQRTLTSANTVLMLSIEGLYDVPQVLQGFTADDVFDTDAVDTAEVAMGVDGHMSAGWVPMMIQQNITLQGDSPSIDIIEAWYNAQQTARELYYANGIARVKSVGKSYTMVKGVLRMFPVTPSVKRIVQPRRFSITWERVSVSPLL